MRLITLLILLAGFALGEVWPGPPAAGASAIVNELIDVVGPDFHHHRGTNDVKSAAVDRVIRKHGFKVFGGVKPGGDLVCSPDAPSDPAERAAKTLPVGYTHPLYLRSSAKALATLALVSRPKLFDWCIQTGPTGVLDPREMWRWPDSEVPAVFEVYTMVIGRLWHTRQLACLNDIFSRWQNDHTFSLADDLLWAVRSDLWIGDCWAAVPRRHEARGHYVNLTWFARCETELPPPLNPAHFPKPYTQTYGWPEFRDQAVALARCGAKKPVLLQECMVVPWFISILHSAAPPIPLFREDGKISAWRGDQFVDVVYTILWPILSVAMEVDPAQTMVQEWINWQGPTMRKYASVPLSDWPATNSTPFDRSECAIATSLPDSAFSSHYSGSSPNVTFVESPGSAGSFQSWVHAKSARPMTPAVSAAADEWIKFIAEYLNSSLSPTPIFWADLAAKRYPVYRRARERPEFVALLAANPRLQVLNDLIDKGHTIEYPRPPQRYTDLVEADGIVTRFIADIAFKQGLSPTSSEGEVRRAIGVARDRAVVLLELYAKGECDPIADTVFRVVNGTTQVREFDPKKANVTCLASDYARAALMASPGRVSKISCLYPQDVVYTLSPECSTDFSSETFAIPNWDPQKINATCVVVNDTEAPPIALPCQYLPTNSGAGILISIVVAVVLFWNLGIGVMIFRWRRRPAIKTSSAPWSIVLIASTTLLAFCALFEIGPRTRTSCSGFIVLDPLALAVAFAALLVKTVRIYLIFTSTDLQVLKLSDKKMLAVFVPCVFVSILIAAIRGLAGAEAVVWAPVVLSSPLPGLVAERCDYGPAWYWVLQFVFLLGLAVINLVLTCKARSAPLQFSEANTLMLINMLLPAMAVVILPVIILSESELLRSVLKLILILIVAAAVPSRYALPKLYAAYKREGEDVVRALAADDPKRPTPQPSWVLTSPAKAPPSPVDRGGTHDRRFSGGSHARQHLIAPKTTASPPGSGTANNRRRTAERHPSPLASVQPADTELTPRTEMRPTDAVNAT